MTGDRWRRVGADSTPSGLVWFQMMSLAAGRRGFGDGDSRCECSPGWRTFTKSSSGWAWTRPAQFERGRQWTGGQAAAVVGGASRRPPHPHLFPFPPQVRCRSKSLQRLQLQGPPAVCSCCIWREVSFRCSQLTPPLKGPPPPFPPHPPPSCEGCPAI